MSATISLPPPAVKRQTLDDLMREEGKAELIGGKVVKLMASGRLPSRVAFRIAQSLDAHAIATGIGEGCPDGLGYAVPELRSGRESFEPDASYHAYPDAPKEMGFIEGPPLFAVEVRSEHDYGPAADRDITAKRMDYFEAGTKAVWDVDPVAETVKLYLISAPNTAVAFTRGQLAHAEPAVPGWTMAVDSIFG